jgi:hypothetical protein
MQQKADYSTKGIATIIESKMKIVETLEEKVSDMGMR